MVATGQNSVSGYRRYLEKHPEENAKLISSFLIKVTEFMRDKELFTYLQTVLLPELIAWSRTHESQLRIWSAGCATGEEAYSLAILLAELLGDELESFNVRIFATDLDRDAIDFARRATYAASALETMPTDVVQRYFTETASGFQVKKHLRTLVIFGHHDLAQRAAFPRIDLLLCRNVMIYFAPELQKRLVYLLSFALRQGGYLILGKAESTSPMSEYFEQVQSNVKAFVRRGEMGRYVPSPMDKGWPLAPNVLPQLKMPSEVTATTRTSSST